jgi:hypothetical protein
MRVGSQKTRQALLVVGTSMEVSPPPDRLELYTEDGLPVDVGKDRTRARWRGTWATSLAVPYEQNDFVMHEDKLYILADFSLVNLDLPPNLATNGSWVLMTVSGGMKWMGEYDETVDYKENHFVSYAHALWLAVDDIDHGTAIPEDSESHWDLVFRPDRGGFKGVWLPNVIYPAGSTITYNGKVYGTSQEIFEVAPDSTPGGNFGGAYLGIQGKTTQKLDDEVTYIKTFTPVTAQIAGGERAIPLMIDFPSTSLANLTFHIVNHTNNQLGFYVNGSYGAVGGFNEVAAGVTADKPANFASFFGGDGNAQVLMVGPANTLGDVEITVTGADLNPPDPPNTWVAMDGVPVGGVAGQLLSKASSAVGDVQWITPVSGGGAADVIFDEPFNDLASISTVLGTPGVASGKFRATAVSDPCIVRRTGLAITGDNKQIVRVDVGAQNYGGSLIVLRWIDNSNYLYVTVNNGTMGVYRVDSNSLSLVLNGGSCGQTPGTSYWLVGRIIDNNVYCEQWPINPAALPPNVAPTKAMVATLSGAQATKYGKGVTGGVGVGLQVSLTELLDYRLDDWAVALPLRSAF